MGDVSNLCYVPSIVGLRLISNESANPIWDMFLAPIKVFPSSVRMSLPWGVLGHDRFDDCKEFRGYITDNQVIRESSSSLGTADCGIDILIQCCSPIGVWKSR